jgi:glycosyltransferase involved in cell wall biosynthesis
VAEPFLKDSRIRYYRNEKNCGAVEVVDNWNICLGHATGDYVICMGDDDRLKPCCLEVYKSLIEAHPGLNVYHCMTEIINETGTVIGTQEERPEWESALSMLWNRWDHRNKQFIGDFCYRASYLKTTGGYYKLPLAWGSDDITALRAAKEQGIANTQVVCFQYRDNGQTITSSADNAKIKIEAFVAQHRWFSTFLESLSAKELSEADAHYLRTIEAPRHKVIIKALGRYIPDYVKGNPIKLLWCYQKVKHLGIGLDMYVKWYYRSLGL